jgi:hypothetical protein
MKDGDIGFGGDADRDVLRIALQCLRREGGDAAVNRSLSLHTIPWHALLTWRVSTSCLVCVRACACACVRVQGVLLRGIMQGFARAYDMLLPDDLVGSWETGDQMAKNLFLPIHYRSLKQQQQQQQPPQPLAPLKDRQARDKDGAERALASQVVTIPRSLLLREVRTEEASEASEGKAGAAPAAGAKPSVWTEGRAGRVIPDHWEQGVHYGFADDIERYDKVDGYDLNRYLGGFEFTALEEVVVRRGDGTKRFGRIEAMHGDEVVVILGPGIKRDAGDELPFRVLDQRTVGKILKDDWVESEPTAEQGEQTNAVTSWWGAWKSRKERANANANASASYALSQTPAADAAARAFRTAAYRDLNPAGMEIFMSSDDSDDSESTSASDEEGLSPPPATTGEGVAREQRGVAPRRTGTRGLPLQGPKRSSTAARRKKMDGDGAR